MAQKNEELLKFNAEVGKVLQLMIHSLYTNKDIFLRELISNASDACDKLRYEAITAPELLEGQPELALAIKVDKDARTLTISDSGIGMGREELVHNLGTIARSGTQDFLSKLSGDAKKDSSLIGQFGVGFYSAFMVADEVTVVSKRAGSGEAWQWRSDGMGEFTISEAAADNPRGTAITLKLKEGTDDYLDAFRLRHIIETYSNHIGFPISLCYEDVNEVVNTGSALWTKPKSEVSEEQYKEFYHHVAHSPDDPWLTLHNRNEGKLDFTNLLFIPSIKPFDLYHPDRKRRVKLYVKRVYITEENIELVPSYMRFLRGVIDSADLPLNISRETLQANPVLAGIREAVTKRVLSELKKKAASDNEGFTKFWENFGPVLKEGLCESMSPREAILEVCRFATTTQALTGLDDYIARMKDGQDEIFYATGDSAESLKANPKLEGFITRGIEVLLLTDHVDDFWVTVVQDFKGKKFKNITRSDISLDQFPRTDEAKKDEPTVNKDALDELCKHMKNVLGDHVRDVRPTEKLGSSAVCLSIPEGSMDARFERFLIEQKQLQAAASKILEVNPHHAIIRSLAANPKGASDDVIWLLFDQARILEGDNVLSAADFTRRLQGFLEKGLAA